jgi:hypothetical protein
MRDIGVRRLGVWKSRICSSWSQNISAIALRTICTCVALSIGSLQVDAQITTVPATFAPERLEVLQACSTYQNALITTGVPRASGVSTPGRCRAMDFVPLFNGVPLPGNWQSSSYQYHETRLPIQRGKVCIEASDLLVTMSAQLQDSVMSWFASPSAPACTTEDNRVAAGEDLTFNLLTISANGIVGQFRNALNNEPLLTTCQSNLRIAETAMKQMIWDRLHGIAQDEQAAWTTSEQALNDPGTGAADRCTAHCGLCASGWAGTMVCKKTATGPGDYHHNETQTWFVGGTTTQAATGAPIYPTEWTATGSGGVSNGLLHPLNWTVNATGAGTLELDSNPQGISFQRTNSEITVNNGTTLGDAISEFQFDAFPSPAAPVGATSVIGSKTYSGQRCDTPRGGAVCTVVCDWNMQKQ